MDLVIRGGTAVFPGRGVVPCDVGVENGVIAALGQDLPPGAETLDASGRLVLPGVIDSHFHLGIFRPLADDARSESASAVAGGVTSILIYYRGGRNNLLTDTAPVLPPPYSELFPALLRDSAGSFYCDYGYHVAPVSVAHVEEVPWLVRQGVTTLKYYMHYRGIRPGDEPPAKEYVYTDSAYDLGHLRHIMQTVSAANHRGARARVSVHAENPGVIRDATRSVLARDTSDLTPLQLYSASRPTSGERLAIFEAVELARQTGCPLNVLHLSSRDALEAVIEARSRYPDLDILAETTVHHLMLDNGGELGPEAKVNPPIRAASDRDRLWQGIVDGSVQTVVSDHAAIECAYKGPDILAAWYGFGGTELLLPSVLTEGRRRGVPVERLVELLTSAPARYHDLAGRKGDLRVGLDADLVIVDPHTVRTVHHQQLHSAQDFSPFDGLELSGWPVTTILGGRVVFDRGAVVGEPGGRYLSRPL